MDHNVASRQSSEPPSRYGVGRGRRRAVWEGGHTEDSSHNIRFLSGAFEGTLCLA